MTRALRALPWLLAGAAVAWFLAHEPTRSVAGADVRAHGRAVAAAAAVLGVQWLLGVGLLKRFAPAILAGDAAWLPAVAAGIGTHGLAMLGLAAAGGAGSRGSGGLLAVLAIGGVALCRARIPLVRPALPSAPALGLGVALLVPATFAALAPATDTDEIYQHLALAKLVSTTGGLVGGMDHPDGSRPMPVQLIFAALHGLGGASAPKLWHLGVAVLLLLGARDLATRLFGPTRGEIGPLCLLLSYTFLHEAGLAYNDLPAALWLLCAFQALSAGHATAMGLALGMAVAAKYTAAPAAVGIALGWLVLHPGARPRLLRAAAAGLLLLAPWWVRNVLDGLHPLFPYAGWPESTLRFQFVEKYGAGRQPLDFLLLPYRLLVESKTTDFAFLGRLSLGFLPIAIGLGWASLRGEIASRPTARALALALGIGCVGWAGGPQLCRHLLPLAGLAALAGGALARPRLAAAMALASLPANLAPEWEGVPGRARVVSGADTVQEYLDRELPGAAALQFFRQEVPSSAQVALLFAWQGYWIDQPWILGSVEDHVPARQLIARSPAGVVAGLRERGVEWLFVGDIHFIEKGYRFMAPADFRAQFEAPLDAFRADLQAHATRRFAKGRWEAWSLDAPGAVN